MKAYIYQNSLNVSFVCIMLFITYIQLNRILENYKVISTHSLSLEGLTQV